MAAEVVLGIALIALLAGVGVGYLVSGRNRGRKRVAELENALQAAQGELADYKREVYGEFAQTAEKFRALDKSYNDLHRQLAQSSVALCGDAATPLLEAPAQAALDVGPLEDDLIDVTDEVESVGHEPGEPENMAADAIDDSVDDESADEIIVAEAQAGDDPTASGDDVPTLTDRDAEEAETIERRESA